MPAQTIPPETPPPSNPRRATHADAAGGYLGPEDRIELHTRTLDRAIQLTFIADAKAAPVLALQATLAAVTVSQVSSLVDLLDGSGYATGATVAAWFLVIGYSVFACIGFFLAALVFLPRSHPANGRAAESRSPIYFEDIRSTTREEFRRRGKLLHARDLEDDLLDQAHVVSTIASAKFANVRRAYYVSGVSLALWLGVLVWARL